MNCTNCNAPIANDSQFCEHCGAPVQKPQTTYTAPQPVNVQQSIPEEYRPLSPWAYFGLTLLFSIPIVGFVFLIIFSISGANINRRNFARSYWCNLILVAIVVIAILAFGGIMSMGMSSASYY